MFVETVKLLVCLLLMFAVHAAQTQPPEFMSVVSTDRTSGKQVFLRERFQHFLSKFPSPYYSHVTVGNSRAGKSLVTNVRVQTRTGQAFLAQGVRFKVCDGLLPCTKGIDVVAIPRADGSGTDLYFDVEGGNMAENPEDMSVFLTIGACISSGPMVLLDTVLDDNTVQFVGRVAAHLLDQSSANKGASCSFREGGPALAIVVNKNDAAVRQEAERGGLSAIWSKLTSRADDAVVIKQVYKDIQLFALPFEKDASLLSDLNSAFGKKVRAIDQQLMTTALPVTLVPETSAAASRYQGTAASIAAAVGDVFVQAVALAKDGFYSAPRVRDFVIRDANKAAASCLSTFLSAAAHRAAPTCEERCTGETGGCRVVHEWLAPARAAAEECFVQKTAPWRAGGNHFGASVLDPALKQLNADTQHRADELHNAWQQANSVDPARTQHESRTREVSRYGPKQCSSRYGGKCVLGVGGGDKYADFCHYNTYAVESRSCTFKRCGTFLGCSDWAETTRYDKEAARETREVCGNFPWDEIAQIVVQVVVPIIL